jgi:hypothetical protein
MTIEFRSNMLRVFIIFIAGAEIWLFSGTFSLDLEILSSLDARWFNILGSLATGVLAPLLSVGAIILSFRRGRTVLAAILLCAAPVIYSLPFVAFATEILIYGF